MPARPMPQPTLNDLDRQLRADFAERDVGRAPIGGYDARFICAVASLKKSSRKLFSL